jgi:hypothetical protein
MAVRKSAADVRPEDLPDGITASLVLALAENAVLARAICALAVAGPGRNADIDRILTLELRMARDDAAAIIAAAQRRT